MAEHKLGRVVQFDELSRNFPIRPMLTPASVRAPRSYTWRCDTWLDQGQESACVGFAWTHELIARPSEVKGVYDATARAIYHNARTLDPWPGEDYEGTSVLAGVKAVQQMLPSVITEYRWAFGIADVLATVGYFGPVVLGINWHEDMFNPNAEGRIRPTGAIAGGHAILAVGVSVKKKIVKLHNSWGSSWGLNGNCSISWDDLESLLYEQGEACVPVVRHAA